MRIGTSIIQRTLVAAAIPTLASLTGLRLVGAQAHITLSLPLPEISFFVSVGPPPIPVYEQPDCPDNGYIWTPGYWAWGEEGYFWVPGTWVMAPEIGLLWTPGYWGWGGETYVFHSGYWGPHVGFYGGVNYGHGYGGSGYDGGHWQGRDFAYNRAVTNVHNTHITNVYNNTVIVNNNHVAFNGGEGGLRTAPTTQDRTVEQERHVPLTTEQNQHNQRAGQDKELLASANRGKPPVAATTKPADFSPKNVLPARAPGGPVGEASLKATPKSFTPPSKLPPPETKTIAPALPSKPQTFSLPPPQAEGPANGVTTRQAPTFHQAPAKPALLKRNPPPSEIQSPKPAEAITKQPAPSGHSAPTAPAGHGSRQEPVAADPGTPSHKKRPILWPPPRK
jgi:hypothetical protein